MRVRSSFYVSAALYRLEKMLTDNQRVLILTPVHRLDGDSLGSFAYTTPRLSPRYFIQMVQVLPISIAYTSASS